MLNGSEYHSRSDYLDINTTLSVIGGKYCCSIIYLLANRGDSIRFNELKRLVGNISCKSLCTTLKKLEEVNLVLRMEYPQIPPKVEYSLTGKGYSLLPVLEEMRRWGEHNRT